MMKFSKLTIAAVLFVSTGAMAGTDELPREELYRQAIKGRIFNLTPNRKDPWVNVEKSISNYNNEFKVGDHCVIQGDHSPDSRIQIIGFPNEKEVLVRYLHLDEVGGTACPHGAIFKMSNEEVLKVAEVTLSRERWEARQNEKIKKETSPGVQRVLDEERRAVK